jgi:hypothetical protein
MRSKIILGLFVFSATISQAQKKNTFIPPNWTPKAHSFARPELQIDSTFIENLHTVLFDENDRCMNMLISNSYNSKSWIHFFIYFEKSDSLNYYIHASLWDTPGKKSIGFFEYNGYFYWFGGDVFPPNIILETKSKKQFSYQEPIPAPYDPQFWLLTYNSQSGIIEVKKKDCQ